MQKFMNEFRENHDLVAILRPLWKGETEYLSLIKWLYTVYQKKISVLKNFRILDCQLNEKTGKDAIFIFKEL